MIVCKFGGSSTTTEAGIENIKRISKNPNRRVFVFSAIGRIRKNDKKLTDLLIDYFDKRDYDLLKKIEKRINYLCNITKERICTKKLINEITSSNDRNFVVSRGEYVTTKIMSKFLGLKFVPAEKVVMFDGDKVDYNSTEKRIKKYLQKHQKVCTCGYYGYDRRSKKIKLFSRGGGDTTGAILSKILGAKVYENYTDVCGVKEVNPKLFENAKTIKRISYADMETLSSYDCNVLHKSVCEILGGTKIKTKIINLFDIKGEKTEINNCHKKVNFFCFKKNKNKFEILLNVLGKKNEIIF